MCTKSNISKFDVLDALAEDLSQKPFYDLGGVLPASLNEWPDCPLLFSRKEGFGHDEPSSHDRFVLVLTLRGASDVLLDGTMLDLPERRALLIFPYQFHHFIHTHSFKLSWLFMTFTMDNADHFLPLQNRSVAIPVDCCEEIKQISDDFHNTEFSDELKSVVISSRLQIVLSMLLANMSSDEKAKSVFAEHSMYGLVRSVAKMVSENLDFDFSVRMAAEEVGVSVSYLQKVFHKVLGIGVGTYIRNHKVLHAARLLKTTNKNVSEIASECGFDSLYSFSRTFKKNMKLSPRSFRNNPLD